MIACLSPNGQIVLRGSEAPTRLIVATLRGVSVLERAAGDKPWTHRGRTLDGHHCSSVTLEPERGGVFAGMHSGGLWFSADGGETWEPRSNGLTKDHVYSIAYARQREGLVLYACTQPVGLFRSLDYGRSWVELPALARMPGHEEWTFPSPPHEAHCKGLAFDPRDPQTMYAAIEQGAFMRSSDGGESWREFEGYAAPDDFLRHDIHRVVSVPSNPDELFLTTGIGLYYSPNRGESWERLTDSSFRIGYPDQLIFSPSDDRVLYMCGSLTNPLGWRQTHHAHGIVMKSSDRGRSWEEASNGLPVSRPNVEALSLAAYPSGFTLFVGDTDGTVYASDDGAQSWHLIVDGLAPVSKVGHYRHLQLTAV
jgi:photosystem II stability/assembly factor-like uncharacterized protein